MKALPVHKRALLICRDAANQRLVAFSFLFVLVWRVLLETLNHIVFHLQPIRPYWPAYLQWLAAPVSSVSHGLGDWAHWDGYHFLGIVLTGYHHPGLNGQYSETAFFPTFPYLVRAASRLLHLNPVITGLAINFIFCVVICATLYRLTILLCERYLPKSKINPSSAAKLSVALFFLYPSSFFLAAFYADALVVATATLAIYLALRQRYFLAALCAMVSTSAKSTGIVLLPVLLLALPLHLLRVWLLRLLPV